MPSFFYLLQIVQDKSNGPWGPSWLFPQNVGAYLAIIMSGIALWGHIKKGAAKSADLDGLGGRVGRLENSMQQLTGEVKTLTTMMQSFVAVQTQLAKDHGQLTQITENCELEGKEMRREINIKLDRLSEHMQGNTNRLTRLEERLKIANN